MDVDAGKVAIVLSNIMKNAITFTNNGGEIIIRPRPAVLHGYTRNIKAPEGTVNITVNSDEDGPLEVFVNVGRAGSDVAALAEAMGRLVSVPVSAAAWNTRCDAPSFRRGCLEKWGRRATRSRSWCDQVIRRSPRSPNPHCRRHGDR